MIYYVYVKDDSGKHILYGQSEDVFEANEMVKRAKIQGWKYAAIWGNLINF